MIRLVVGAVCLLLALASLIFPSGAAEREKAAQEAVLFAAIGVPLAVWGIIDVRRRTTADPIRWWRVRAASVDLTSGAISQSSQLQYLTSFLIVEIFSWGIDTQVFAFGWHDKSSSSDALELSLLAVKVFGPMLAYVANGGRRGADFILRFFVLSFPIRVRAAVFTLLLALAVRAIAAHVHGFASGAGIDLPTMLEASGAGLFWLTFNAFHYSALAFAMQKLQFVRRPKEPTSR